VLAGGEIGLRTDFVTTERLGRARDVPVRFPRKICVQTFRPEAGMSLFVAESVGFVPGEPAAINTYGRSQSLKSPETARILSTRYKTGTPDMPRTTVAPAKPLCTQPVQHGSGEQQMMLLV
jgi:hypothetical protein